MPSCFCACPQLRPSVALVRGKPSRSRLASGDALSSHAVNRVLIADTDREDSAGGGIHVGVQDPEPGRSTARYIELDPCQAGEVAAHPPHPELLAGHPSMRQVIEHGASSGNHIRAVFGQRFDILRDGRWKMSR